MRSRTAADMEGGSLVSMTTDPCTLSLKDTPLKGTSLKGTPSRGSGPVDPRSWRSGLTRGAANQVS